jgi:hypothetical protein
MLHSVLTEFYMTSCSSIFLIPISVYEFCKTLKFVAILAMVSVITIVTLAGTIPVHTINILLVCPVVTAFPYLT